MKQLCSYLKPQGDLLVLAYPRGTDYYEFMQEALQEYPEYIQHSAYHTMLTVQDYEKILKSCGIEFQQFEARTLYGFYKNKKALKDYIRGWLASFVPYWKSVLFGPVC